MNGQTQEKIGYEWDTIAIGGGGYATGIIIHPTEPDLVYIRTDVGGAVRWDSVNERWIPIADTIGALHPNFSGVESLAIDPSNPDLVYLVVGMYRKEQLARWGNWQEGDPEPSGMFKSRDHGATWTRLSISPSSGANEDWRWVGERFAVDPNNGDIVLYGSRNEGLWRSTDAGETWAIVEGLPVSKDQSIGVVWVLLDKTHVYAAVAGEGIFQSTDRGETWVSINGDAVSKAQIPQGAALGNDGALYVTLLAGDGHSAGVKKFYRDTWTDVTPQSEINYNAIAVDPFNPERVIVFEHKHNWNSAGFLSENGGDIWEPVCYDHHSMVPWYLPEMWASAVASVVFDPHVPNRVWYTDWYNIWRTEDISVSPSKWQNYERGHEETVILTLLTPHQGAPLFSGMADLSGFRHLDLDQYPQENIGKFLLQDITGMDYAEANPDFIVAVGARRWNNSGDGLYSIDGGETWTKFPTTPPQAIHGKVAVSSDGESIVWIPTGQLPYYSIDCGVTWTASAGVPSGTVGILWDTRHPLAADRDVPGRFYLLHGNNLSRSDDGGATWAIAYRFLDEPELSTKTEGENTPEVSAWTVEGNYRSIETMPGQVWVQVGNRVFHSEDRAETFNELHTVDSMQRFTLGVNADGLENPAIYVVGGIRGENGVFLSSNMGETWTRIDTPELPFFNVSHLRGDRQVFGRVYLGMNGRGIWVGEKIYGTGNT